MTKTKKNILLFLGLVIINLVILVSSLNVGFELACFFDNLIVFILDFLYIYLIDYIYYNLYTLDKFKIAVMLESENKKTIDDLKCCGNCKHHENLFCLKATKDKKAWDYCNSWSFDKRCKK